MKLRKINKILQDPTTSKRLKKEIHYLFEELEKATFRKPKYDDLIDSFRVMIQNRSKIFDVDNPNFPKELNEFIKENWIQDHLGKHPIESTEKLFNQPKGGEITVLKATQTIPGVITKGDLYYATANDKYYIFSNDKGIPTHVLIEGMEYFELLPIKENKGL